MKYRIYVIEDDENIRNLICVALENFGYCASGFETAEEALDNLSALLRRGGEAQREYPAMFVFDWMLPGMDGMEVLERLRQTDAETKVLILSARSQVADKVAGLDAGGERLSGKALSFAGAGGKGAQPDTQAVHSAKHSLGLRRHFL